MCPGSLGVTRGSAEEKPAGTDPRSQLGMRSYVVFTLEVRD